MFQVGDHAILINGMFNDFHGVGWVRSVMTEKIGQEFVYDSAWLVPVEQDEPDPQELDDMFSEFE